LFRVEKQQRILCSVLSQEFAALLVWLHTCNTAMFLYVAVTFPVAEGYVYVKSSAVAVWFQTWRIAAGVNPNLHLQ
jgi:hypothetical protein